MSMQALGPCQVSSLASAPLLRVSVWPPHCNPSPGLPVLHMLPFPKNQSLSVRADRSLSELPTVLDRVSLWSFPGWCWEGHHSNTITWVSGTRVHSLYLPHLLLPPVVLSFRWAHSCLSVPGAPSSQSPLESPRIYAARSGGLGCGSGSCSSRRAQPL